MDLENAQIISDLLEEFKEHRNAIKLMLVDLEKIKAKVDMLFPESLDKRYMRFFEEKVKSTTELFKALLDMRKEISKTLKDEIEIRRKLEREDGGGSDGIAEMIDVRGLAKQIEKFQSNKNKVTETIESKITQ